MSRETEDRVALQDVLSTYADVINRRAWDELDDLFVPDCEIVIDTRRGDPLTMIGGGALGEFVGSAIERFDFFQFVILSARLWVDGGDEARGRLYMREVRHDRTTREQSQAFGVYHDRFRRDRGRWRFAARQYHSLARTSVDGSTGLDVFEFPAL